ncbi:MULTISPECIES: cell division protein ZapA [unclassified Sphingomonas]|mgnify:CR=1 FL=1|uniref:cell division protein ZapA n=1 Tax=unclassified Sphingomonas TaxID=196159 RepID=UPI00082E2326|nr:MULTISPECIES: cell division protein ZapA [unclassified Sphingomonas]
MSHVLLTVAGRQHQVACRPGDEARLERLAALLDRHSDAAIKVAGGVPGERAMLFVALMIADELADAQANPPSGVADHLLSNLAERLEAIAAVLEEDAPTS